MKRLLVALFLAGLVGACEHNLYVLASADQQRLDTVVQACRSVRGIPDYRISGPIDSHQFLTVTCNLIVIQ